LIDLVGVGFKGKVAARRQHPTMMELFRQGQMMEWPSPITCPYFDKATHCMCCVIGRERDEGYQLGLNSFASVPFVNPG